MSDLFAGMEESLSPREKWLREHNVHTHHAEHEEEPWTAVSLPGGYDSVGEWMAENGDEGVEYGMTREEAINKLAQRLFAECGVKHWSMS